RDAGSEARARAKRAGRRDRARGAAPSVRRGARNGQPHAGDRRGRQGVCDAGRDQPSNERRVRRTQGARAMVTRERVAQGMTFDEYVKFVSTPENLKREGSFNLPRKDYGDFLRRAFESAQLNDAQRAAWQWIVAQPAGPANILVISEDWSSDCRRDVPM